MGLVRSDIPEADGLIMPYKLLIEFDISFESPLKRFLKPGEVIRGEPVELTFSVTNLGTVPFPGGRVNNWRILYGPARDVVDYSPTANNVECSEIWPGQKATLLSERVVPLTEGLSWIEFSIEPKSEEEAVEYYQSPEHVVLQRRWTNCFYVINREMLLLTSLIEELTNRR
jgi:hypothetical protein